MDLQSSDRRRAQQYRQAGQPDRQSGNRPARPWQSGGGGRSGAAKDAPKTTTTNAPGCDYDTPDYNDDQTAGSTTFSSGTVNLAVAGLQTSTSTITINQHISISDLTVTVNLKDTADSDV